MKILKNPLIIVANGKFPTHKVPIDKLNNASTIIACDGAVNSLIDKGYVPDLIIGDLDSISLENINAYKDRIIQIEEQSENDLRKSINYVISKNINGIDIIGATGEREDHAIGNIFSILDYDNIKIRIITDNGLFYCINKDTEIKSFKGQQISLFTTDTHLKITTNGLKYNFNSTAISTLYYGTLNESTSNVFNIKMQDGKLLIFQKFKD